VWIFDQPRVLRWAIVAVSVMIVLALVAIVVLAYALINSDAQRPAWEIFSPQNSTVTPSATVTPAYLQYVTATRSSGKRPPTPIRPTRVPINPTFTVSALNTQLSTTTTPIPPATPPAPTSDSGDTALPSTHPTFEPTTQPCSTCHSSFQRP